MTVSECRVELLRPIDAIEDATGEPKVLTSTGQGVLLGAAVMMISPVAVDGNAVELYVKVKLMGRETGGSELSTPT